MRIKRRHIKMARAADRVVVPTKSRDREHFLRIAHAIDAIWNWHRAAKGKHK